MNCDCLPSTCAAVRATGCTPTAVMAAALRLRSADERGRRHGTLLRGGRARACRACRAARPRPLTRTRRAWCAQATGTDRNFTLRSTSNPNDPLGLRLPEHGGSLMPHRFCDAATSRGTGPLLTPQQALQANTSMYPLYHADSLESLSQALFIVSQLGLFQSPAGVGRGRVQVAHGRRRVGCHGALEGGPSRALAACARPRPRRRAAGHLRGRRTPSLWCSAPKTWSSEP